MMILNSFINQGLWCHNNPLRKLKAGDSFGAQIAARIKNLTVFTHPHSPTFTDTDCSLESVNCVWTPPLRERKATPWKRNRKLGKNRIPSQKQESCLTLWLNGGRVDIELILQFRTAANVFWGQSCSRNCIGLRAELYMRDFRCVRVWMCVEGRVNGWERWRLRRSFENKESEVSPHALFLFLGAQGSFHHYRLKE